MQVSADCQTTTTRLTIPTAELFALYPPILQECRSLKYQSGGSCPQSVGPA